MVNYKSLSGWALILGGSSGLGLATAKKLGSHGMDLVIVHRDRKKDAEAFYKEIEILKSTGTNVITYNADATRQDKVEKIVQEASDKGIRFSVIIHSISRGNVKPLTGAQSNLKEDDFQSTMKAMGFSLIDWVQEVSHRNLLEENARIIAFTSEGSTRPLPSYAAVSAAKASIEALIRSIALEYADMGVRANCIQAGVTNTPSLRLIPRANEIIEHAMSRSLLGRITVPEDVANAVYLLCLPEGGWINGTIIKVDGGESLQ